MSSATGGRAPLLSREEGSSLAVETTPGEARPRGSPGWATHSRSRTNGGRRGDPGPQWPRCYVKAIGRNPELGPGQPLRGRPLDPHAAVRKMREQVRRHPQEGRSILSVMTEAISRAHGQSLPLQSLVQIMRWCLASSQVKHWAIHPHFTGLLGGRIRENTHCVGSLGVAVWSQIRQR